MHEQEIIDSSLAQEGQLSFTPTAKNHLVHIKNWSRVLSVAYFIFSGLILLIFLAMVFTGAWPRQSLGTVIIFFMVVLGIALLFFFLGFYCFRFALFSAKSIRENNRLEWEDALKNLRIFLTIFGIMSVITLLVIFIGVALEGF